ncbi:hypothetical protein B0T25DRAFT_570317 [Lasiosphaeria hispida]|uniref:Uncharacterized protein n=1 Tax=Lasiosphaeria hispida TaxID=260671 RepID=A0AAJ0HF57_9PEZI|nr:hypothetical protein B0T25DRAFT_570317 [Lasiosphaeria hispida]
MTHPGPIIVIIPGAFHRPSHYGDVIHPLQSLGYIVLSVLLVVCGDTISLSATPSDAKAVHVQFLPLLNVGDEAVIEAHSYGSTVATACIQGQMKAERAVEIQRGGGGGGGSRGDLGGV